MDIKKSTYIIYITASRMKPPVGMLRGLVICGAVSRHEAIGMALTQAIRRWSGLDAVFDCGSFHCGLIPNAEIFAYILEKAENKPDDAPDFIFMIKLLNGLER